MHYLCEINENVENDLSHNVKETEKNNSWGGWDGMGSILGWNPSTIPSLVEICVVVFV